MITTGKPAPVYCFGEVLWDLLPHGALPGGAAYYTPAGSWQVAGISVEVADTVGSGDSFLAAFITGHARQEPPEIILRKVVAKAAFIAARKGGCPEYGLAEYENFCT